MDEGELLGNDPVWLLLAELAKTAFRQNNFQLAYLLDTSRGDICRQMRREEAEISRFMTELTREPGALAA